MIRIVVTLVAGEILEKAQEFYRIDSPFSLSYRRQSFSSVQKYATSYGMLNDEEQ